MEKDITNIANNVNNYARLKGWPAKKWTGLPGYIIEATEYMIRHYNLDAAEINVVFMKIDEINGVKVEDDY